MSTLHRLEFAVDDGTSFSLEPRQAVIAGWTGRDRGAIDHHIEELAAIGVPRPSTVPLYYRVGTGLLTQAARIDALGPDSSGEVEPVLIAAGGRWWLGLGSDHTDRALETHSVAASKQVCAKPLARAVWAWDAVRAHADQIELASQILEAGRWVPYQQGHLARIRPLDDLLAAAPADVLRTDGLVMFCGTLGAIADAHGRGVRPAPAMRLLLRDPVRGREISHEYETRVLPVVA